MQPHRQRSLRDAAKEGVRRGQETQTATGSPLAGTSQEDGRCQDGQKASTPADKAGRKPLTECLGCARLKKQLAGEQGQRAERNKAKRAARAARQEAERASKQVGRLPHASRVDIIYDATAEEWFGSLVVDGVLFQGRASSQSKLMHELDTLYRKSLLPSQGA